MGRGHGSVRMFPPGTEGKDGETKEVLRKYVPNYRMNLIDAGHMEESRTAKTFGKIYNRYWAC